MVHIYLLYPRWVVVVVVIHLDMYTPVQRTTLLLYCAHVVIPVNHVDVDVDVDTKKNEIYLSDTDTDS